MATGAIPEDWLKQARTIALALPESVEKETWDHPTYRVRDKIFAGIGAGENDKGELVVTMSMKAAPGEQESLLATGHPFFRPQYVGNRGWIGIVIDHETDWAEVEELVIDSYRTIAPKTLARTLDLEDSG